MINRIWDPKEKYKHGFLKESTHWALEVSYRQHTLGSFVIFAKRKVEQLSDLHDEELRELKIVMDEMQTALRKNKTFCPDRFNYLQLGNALPHLHFHGIPRYKDERKFLDKTWIDSQWGKPPKWSFEDVDNDLVIALREEILPYLINK